MRAQYGFSKMKGARNPYRNQLKQSITIRLDRTTIGYFKGLAEELNMPYQHLINLYLRDCALNQKKLALKWAS
jgi:predicted DNA binding CopG/RHH family protein